MVFRGYVDKRFFGDFGKLSVTDTASKQCPGYRPQDQKYSRVILTLDVVLHGRKIYSCEISFANKKTDLGKIDQVFTN
jgi:hypothetical protein